jgi:hypothetical protein
MKRWITSTGHELARIEGFYGGIFSLLKFVLFQIVDSGILPIPNTAIIS